MGQLLRYLIVGGAGYLLAMACFAVAIAAGIPPYAAIVLVFVLNGAFNFTFFRIWVFPPSGRNVESEAWRFAAVALLTLTVNYALFAVLYTLLGVPAVPSQALAIVGATPVSFAANRGWAFRLGATRPARIDTHR